MRSWPGLLATPSRAPGALACGIAVVGDDHKLASVGAYVSPGYGLSAGQRGNAERPASDPLAGVTGEEVVEAMTAGSIVIGEVPGKPVVLPDARSEWESNPVTRAFAATLMGLDWQAGVYVPLSWESRVFGLFGVYLPGRVGRSERGGARVLCRAGRSGCGGGDQLPAGSQARQAATVLERTRLARELHDSVSQAVFSMTMHARAAQLSLAEAGLDEGGSLGRSIAESAELTAVRWLRCGR